MRREAEADATSRSVKQKETSVKADSYVFFDSNCREAFEFYQSLGIGRIETMMTNAEAPAGMGASPGRETNIMHASIRIGDNALMGSDMPPGSYAKPQGFCIHLSVPDLAEAERIFAALSAGGAVQMALEETFWALRCGACTDRFGIPWMIGVDRPA